MQKIMTALLFFVISSTLAQNKVAITIDDVPNTLLYADDSFQSHLLQNIYTLKIPVAIFINESLIVKNEAMAKNLDLLNQWIKSEFVTLGNHTFTHARYSTTGFSRYVAEVLKGESFTRVLAKKYNKVLTHFRFPYNDLGKDSIQQAQITSFLASLNYKITPFTIESSDWMYNAIYAHYLKRNQLSKAKAIGEAYVAKTLEFFDYFGKLSFKKFNRNINQIYLCHDNKLNRDYLPKIVQKLKARNYTFITLDEALKDSVYSLPNKYYKKWGISWFYRWINDKSERKEMMMKEPSTEKVYKLYQEIQ